MQSSSSKSRGTVPGRSLQRSVSNKLRTLVKSKEIENIQSLVAALSGETDPVRVKTLRNWMQRCIDCFSKLIRESIHSLTVGDVHEFVKIGKLEVRNPSDKNLLQSWFNVLHNAILQDKAGEENTVRSI